MASDPLQSGDIELIAASLRADISDIAVFVETLAVKLEDALPGHVEVDRARQGLRGPKLVRRIMLDAGGERLELRHQPGRSGASSIETLRAHVSGGIVLKTETIGIDDWLVSVAAAVSAEANQSERVRQALERLLLGR